MLTCTFFGHRDCPEIVKKDLKIVIEQLIMNNKVTNFFIGTDGMFDNHCLSTLTEIKKDFPHITYTVVLSSLPTKTSYFFDYSNTILPEGIEIGHPKFAIERRNKWLINNSDYVICYVKQNFGGAYKFMELAKKHNKIVINLHVEKTP
jgi:uncharacterized phage-like protein YoqJ